MVKFRKALLAGTFMLALAGGKARADGKWKYKDLRPPEEKTAEVQAKENKQVKKKKNNKKQEPEYLIRIEFATPEVQTKDTLINVPVEETERKEIPFWFGIGLLGLGGLGIAGAGLSIFYKLKNKKFEQGEPVAVYPAGWKGEFPEHLPIELYVYYPYKLKAVVSSALISGGLMGAYLLANSSETRTKYVEQVAQVVVEPVPSIVQKDSSSTRFIIYTEAGWDSTLSHLSRIDTVGKKVKIVFSGDSGRIYELRSILPKATISIQ